MSCREFKPSHAYIPGQNSRHEDGAFDHIRDTAKHGMDADALANSDAFLVGLKFIDDGFFWEAHEVLEPIWMALDETSDERRFVQGLIQMANGLLKLQMKRPKAARRLATIAEELVGSCECTTVMGLSKAQIAQRILSLKQESNVHNNAKE